MSNKVSKTVEGNLNRSGRPKGVPNKSTGMAREAIARFVDGNASKMEEWLQSVAYGIQATDKEGNPKYSPEGNPVYVVPPNPEKAFGMLQAVMEYHVPKLARTEVVGDATAPITHIYKWQDD
jgi:hypothetical protein